MRIVLDLQACQASSMHRGIGRYSMALALAMARNSGGARTAHRPQRRLSRQRRGAPQRLRRPGAAVAHHAPSTRRCRWPKPTSAMPGACARPNGSASITWPACGPTSCTWPACSKAWATTPSASVLHGDGRFDTAVTLYDLIPLMRKERYLADPHIAAWYYRKLQSLKNAELLLAISGHRAQEAIGALHCRRTRWSTSRRRSTRSSVRARWTARRSAGAARALRPGATVHHVHRRHRLPQEHRGPDRGLRAAARRAARAVPARHRLQHPAPADRVRLRARWPPRSACAEATWC